MQTSSPFSRPASVVALPDEGIHLTIEADPAERAALAKINDLVALNGLVGRFALTPQRGGHGVLVTGEITATVVQTCTVSLDPFESALREEVDLVFMPAAGVAAWASRKMAQPDPEQDDEDPPDVIVDGRIDLGQVAAEYLALGIDPYPRKPGVAFDAGAFGSDKDPSPFAALARLKKEP